jgi:hypothetical protein
MTMGLFSLMLHNTLTWAAASLLIIALVRAYISAPYDNVCK